MSAATVAALAVTLSVVSGGRIDREFVRQTVESLAALVRQEYFDPEVAARVDESLRQRLASGRYAGARTEESLAAMLTRDLFATTHDKHLVATVVRDEPPEPSSGETARDDARAVGARRSNFGVHRVEILSGNVGYLDITAFYRPEEARETISAAMETLRYADALILDLRDNGGGSPDTVALVASYVFAEPGLPLFDIVPRSGSGGGRYATESSDLPGRNGTRPVYVLTARSTFSAGEGLAFILQERGRAAVVGEHTAGAANPGRPYRVNARFEVVVPNGKVRTAVSGRNWEVIGVAPNTRVAAADALDVAHAHALRALLALAPEGPWHDALRRHLKALRRRRR